MREQRPRLRDARQVVPCRDRGDEKSIARQIRHRPTRRGTDDLTADLRVPPMVGTYRLKADSIEFSPRFAFEPGVSYRAVFRPDHFPANPIKESKPIVSVSSL